MDETLKQFNPILLDGTNIDSHTTGSDNEGSNSVGNDGDEPLDLG